MPKAHYEVSKKALLHNKHVYTEKPMAINIKDGKIAVQEFFNLNNFSYIIK